MLAHARRRLGSVFGTGRYEQPPPDEKTVDSLIAYFRWRGWILLDRHSATRANFYYPHSFRGVLDEDNRRQIPPDVGLIELECDLARHGNHWIARFTTCGAVIGCSQHRSTPVIIAVHSGAFPAVLHHLERQARTLDLDKIASCLLFGPCGSTDNPDHPYRPPQPEPGAPEPDAPSPGPAADPATPTNHQAGRSDAPAPDVGG
ncbi:hypothetical protein [Amycolatopsis sp. cmx-8-4]|uniref:hypothetical protein n=1 Tax=Amycolatopsis sp. cmx-8-4 TaxID=2790947 RepID=UPI00397BB81E